MLFLSILSCFSFAFCSTQACVMHLAPTLPPRADCDGRTANTDTRHTLRYLYGALHFSSCPAAATLAARQQQFEDNKFCSSFTVKWHICISFLKSVGLCACVQILTLVAQWRIWLTNFPAASLPVCFIPFRFMWPGARSNATVGLLSLSLTQLFGCTALCFN